MNTAITFFKTVSADFDVIDKMEYLDAKGNKAVAFSTYDEWAENPLEFFDTVGLTVTQAPYGQDERTYPMNRQIDESDEAVIFEYAETDDAANIALVKHYKRQGYAAKLVNLTGYSQGEWVDGVLVAQDTAELESAHKMLRDYFAGDVYCIWTAPVVDGAVDFDARELYTSAVYGDDDVQVYFNDVARN